MVVDRDLKTQILIWYYVAQAKGSLNISSIARDAGNIDRKTVRNIVQQWEQFQTTEPAKRCPPQKVAGSVLEQFYSFAETLEGRKSTLKEIRNKFKLPYTTTRISQLLVKRGLRCRVMKKKPHLEPRHIKDRIDFANFNKGRDWNKVIFSDEKTVQNFFNGKKSIRRRPGEVLGPEGDYLSVPNRKTKVNMWGFISPNCWGLYILPDKASGDDYIKTLQTCFLPVIQEKMEEFVLMQDGASIHSPAKKFLTERNIELLQWPAKSPDLNPIENVWGLMQKLVNQYMLKKGTPKHRTHLFSLCKSAFNVVCKKTHEISF